MHAGNSLALHARSPFGISIVLWLQVRLVSSLWQFMTGIHMAVIFTCCCGLPLAIDIIYYSHMTCTLCQTPRAPVHYCSWQRATTSACMSLEVHATQPTGHDLPLTDTQHS